MEQRQIAKILSANDSGETGANQSGILVPKDPAILSFFPALDKHQLNPRVHLRFLDDSGTFWEFAFIYYNNSFFGGTVNEYRLTRMTKYIRQSNLTAGDEIILATENGCYRISYKRKQKTEKIGRVLQLGAAWRVIQL